MLEYTKKFLDFYYLKRPNVYDSHRITTSTVKLFLRPESPSNENCIDTLPYELRIGIARYLLERLAKEEKFKSGGFSYYINDYSRGSLSDTLDGFLLPTGYECFSGKEYDNENRATFIKTTENFHDIFLDGLYRYWDDQIKSYSELPNQDIQYGIDNIFRFQMTGYWFYNNRFNKNMLKVFLEYLKEKGYKVNMFQVFNSAISTNIQSMDKGISHYDCKPLFKTLILIFDFYSAVLDIYGDENKKVLTKLQDNLNEIFSKKLEVEKLGFMNTFLFTNKIKHSFGLTRSNRKLDYTESKMVEYFWNKIYTENLNPTIKKIFINALIYSWNKSSLPKVKNSIKLLVELATHQYFGRYSFYYYNQSLFYKDILSNTNNLKKSVRTILFSKAMTEEGGLF